jgi:hypothetical protein
MASLATNCATSSSLPTLWARTIHPKHSGLKRNEEAAFGKYRTQRLVLDAWDRMERGELSVSDAGIVVRPAEPVRPPRLAAIDAVALPDLA